MKRIHVCHVGSRNGWGSNPLVNLKNDVFLTLFDADEESVKHDTENFNPKGMSKSNFQFVSVALSNKKETRSFNLNNDPNTSSILDYNDELDDFILLNPGFNYSLKKACKPVKKMKLKCQTVDGLFEKKPVDFLVLDTQGFEYEILEGSEQHLKDHILGVITEIEFVEFYKNQKTFVDIMNYMIGKGFYYVGLEDFYTMYYKKSLDHARGRGFAFSGDAFFIKDYSKIVKSKETNEQKASKLFKLAAISLCYGLLDYAYNILDDAHDLYPKEISKLKKTRHVNLCLDYYKSYKKLMDNNYKNQEYYGSIADFRGESKTEEKKDKKTTPAKKPLLVILSRKVMPNFLREFIADSIRFVTEIMETFHYKFAPKDEIETVLYKYDLKAQALLQKRARSKNTFNSNKIFQKIYAVKS